MPAKQASSCCDRYLLHVTAVVKNLTTARRWVSFYSMQYNSLTSETDRSKHVVRALGKHDRGACEGDAQHRMLPTTDNVCVPDGGSEGSTESHCLCICWSVVGQIRTYTLGNIKASTNRVSY